MHRMLRAPVVLAILAAVLFASPIHSAERSPLSFDPNIGISNGAEMAGLIATGKAPRIDPASLDGTGWSGLPTPRVQVSVSSAESMDARGLPYTEQETVYGGLVYEAMDFDDNAVETGGTVFIPPDPIGAAGTNGLLAVTNVMIEMREKDGTLRFRDSLQDFFAGTPGTLGTFTFDPKVVYDHYEDRFVVVTLERELLMQGGSQNASRILLAVSKTGDPATATSADWWFASIDSKIKIGGMDRWADYPGFEIDEEAIYITNNMVSFTLTGSIAPRLWIVDKGVGSGFYAGSPIGFSVEDPVGAVGGLATTLMPAQVFGGSGVAPGVGTFLVGYDGLTLGGPGGLEAVQIIRVDDPLGTPSFTLDLPFVGDIEDIGGVLGFPALPDAPQSGTPALLEVNDRRALDAIVRNGSLHLVATINPNSGPDLGQTTAHWFRMDVSAVTSSASAAGLITLADQGNVGGEDIAAATYTFFPAIAVNGSDDVKIGFSASAATIFPGAYATGRTSSDPAGTVQNSATVRGGDDFYLRTFGGPRNRWGDYTGISVDPTDDDLFWVFSQYAQTQGTPINGEMGRWGTVWAQCSFNVIASEPAPPFLTQWGSSGSAQGQFDILNFLDIDDCGNVYAVDAGNDRVQKFDENGDFLTEWGGNGTGNGQFDNPVDITIDALRNIYVSDANNHRVQKFDEDGNYLTQWGSFGTGSGQFRAPRGLGYNSSTDNIYVVDADNDRIQVFDTNGAFQFEFGSAGSGDGQFGLALDVEVSLSGDVYVTDETADRVQKFDAGGAFLTQWGTSGTGNGQFSLPTGIGSDANGNVFVADPGTDRIQKFDPDGAFLTVWGTTGSGDGEFSFPMGVAVDPLREQIAVTDRDNDRVQKFGTANNGVLPFVLEWGTLGTGPGEFAFASGVDVDNAANVYVVDTVNRNVQKFNADGSLILSWGTPGIGPGEFNAPQGVGTDPTGAFVYVVDSDAIQKYDSSGNFILEWGSNGGGDGQFVFPLDLEVDGNGNVYVVDSGFNRVQKFDADGNFLLKWGTPGTGPGEFDVPNGIALDSSGDVYVTDISSSRVQKFDASGNFILEWGNLGIGPGQFDESSGIAADGSGNIYVGDYALDRIQVFDTSGNYVGQWGCSGTGPGQFGGITLAATDTQGDLYVADAGNGRIQRFGNEVVDVAEEGGTPPSFVLHPSIPNPTRGSSLIAFDLPKPSSVSLSIYDVRGRWVRSAYDNTLFTAGSHRWVWDGRDASGSRVSAGIYFYSIVTKQGTESRKLVVVE